MRPLLSDGGSDMSLTRQLKGRALHIVDRLVPVRPQLRTPAEHDLMERESRRMHLYYARHCPSSISIRRHCERIGLRVVEKDVHKVNTYRNELLSGGGEPRVPCLRIDDEQGARWLYSPEAIRDFLNKRF